MSASTRRRSLTVILLRFQGLDMQHGFGGSGYVSSAPGGYRGETAFPEDDVYRSHHPHHHPMAAHSNSSSSQYATPSNLALPQSAYSSYLSHAHHGGTTDHPLPPRFYRDVDPWTTSQQASYFPCPTNPFASEVPRIVPPYESGNSGSSSGGHYGHYMSHGMVSQASRKTDMRGKNGSWPGIDMTGSSGTGGTSSGNTTASGNMDMSRKFQSVIIVIVQGTPRKLVSFNYGKASD